MTWSTIATLVVILATNIGSVLGIYYHFENRVNTVYKRFDQYKESMDSKFVKRDVCDILHKNTADNFDGAIGRIEKRLDKIEELIQTTLTKILEAVTKHA